MAKKPKELKDYKGPIENTREIMLREEDDKIQGRRGFVFKGYKTEKERIVSLKFNSRTIT